MNKMTIYAASRRRKSTPSFLSIDPLWKVNAHMSIVSAAISTAQGEGGIGVIHKNMTIEQQALEVDKVKRDARKEEESKRRPDSLFSQILEQKEKEQKGKQQRGKKWIEQTLKQTRHWLLFLRKLPPIASPTETDTSTKPIFLNVITVINTYYRR